MTFRQGGRSLVENLLAEFVIMTRRPEGRRSDGDIDGFIKI